MSRLRRILTTACILAALGAPPARGAPTSVYNVPIAEIVAPGEVQFDVIVDLTDLRQVNIPHRCSLLTEWGLAPHMEGGVDWNHLGRGNLVQGDVKYRLCDPEDRPWGAAVGVSNVGNDLKPFYYGIVSSKQRRTDGGRLWLHGGLAANDSMHALAGITTPLSPRLDLLSDYISGKGGIFTVALEQTIRQELTATLAMEYLSADDEFLVQIDLGNRGHWR